MNTSHMTDLVIASFGRKVNRSKRNNERSGTILHHFLLKIENSRIIIIKKHFCDIRTAKQQTNRGAIFYGETLGVLIERNQLYDYDKSTENTF